MQTRTWSVVEITCNYVVGYCVAMILNHYVLKWMGFDVSTGQNATIVTIFTVAGLLRSYAVRRLFNWVLSHEHRVR